MSLADTQERIDAGAVKFDGDKPRMDLVPLIAVEGVARVLTFGAQKYAENGWKSVEPWRYQAAMLRHMTAVQRGELIDPESGLPHADHIACNALFLSYFHHTEADDDMVQIELDLKPETTGHTSWGTTQS